MSLGSFVGDLLGLKEVGDLLGMVLVSNNDGLGDGRASIVPIDKLISLMKMGIDISIILMDMLISLNTLGMLKGENLDRAASAYIKGDVHQNIVIGKQYALITT